MTGQKQYRTIAIIAGTFGKKGGMPDARVGDFAKAIQGAPYDRATGIKWMPAVLLNGGSENELKDTVSMLSEGGGGTAYAAVLWAANLMVQGCEWVSPLPIKAAHPETILVCAKDSIGRLPSIEGADIALEQKAEGDRPDFCITDKDAGECICGQLDKDGVAWALAEALCSRLAMNRMLMFTLKKEHVELIANLNFTGSMNRFTDRYVPAIDPKRPFGDSWAVGSALRILGREQGEDGKYSKKDTEFAESLLIELPVALEVVTRHKTFEPGDYSVEQFSSLFGYELMKNYWVLKGALDHVAKTAVTNEREAAYMDTLRASCMEIYGDDPWAVIGRMKESCRNTGDKDYTGFMEKAAGIFEEYREGAWK